MKAIPFHVMLWRLRAKLHRWRYSFDRPSCRKLREEINAPALEREFRVDSFYGVSSTTLDGVFRGMPFHLYARFRIWEFTLIEINAADHPNVDPGSIMAESVGLFPVGEIDGEADVRGFCMSGKYGHGQYAASWIPEPHALTLARICCPADGIELPLTDFSIGSEPVTLSVGQPATAGNYGVEVLSHLLFGTPSPGSDGLLQ